MLNKLMINAINRGMLTAFCAALNMILVRLTDRASELYLYTVQFLSLPGTFWFFLGLMPSSKCECIWKLRFKL